MNLPSQEIVCPQPLSPGHILLHSRMVSRKEKIFPKLSRGGGLSSVDAVTESESLQDLDLEQDLNQVANANHSSS